MGIDNARQESMNAEKAGVIDLVQLSIFRILEMLTSGAGLGKPVCIS